MNAARTAVSQNGGTIVDASKGILGVVAGKSLDQPGQAAVIVYTDQTHAGPIAVPQTIGGLPTRVIPTTAGAVANGTAPTSSFVTPGIHLSQATLEAARASSETARPATHERPGILWRGSYPEPGQSR